MYRPDRIGPWKLGNLDKAAIVDAKTDFDAVDHINPGWACYSLNTVSGEQFTGETVTFSNTTLKLASLRNVGLGVQLTPGEGETNFMYSVSGVLSCNQPKDLLVEFVLGRLDAAPSAVAAVAVSDPILVPGVIGVVNGESLVYSVNTTIVTSTLDGGTPDDPLLDVAAFWHLSNNVGSDMNFDVLRVSVSVHRYTADLFTFDPNR